MSSPLKFKITSWVSAPLDKMPTHQGYTFNSWNCAESTKNFHTITQIVAFVAWCRLIKCTSSVDSRRHCVLLNAFPVDFLRFTIHVTTREYENNLLPINANYQLYDPAPNSDCDSGALPLCTKSPNIDVVTILTVFPGGRSRLCGFDELFCGRHFSIIVGKPWKYQVCILKIEFSWIKVKQFFEVLSP